jgi:hypothetical protein
LAYGVPQSTSEATSAARTYDEVNDVLFVRAPPRFQRLSPIQRWFTRPSLCVLLVVAGIFLDIPILPEKQFFISHAIIIAVLVTLFVRGLWIESRVFQRYVLYVVLAIAPGVAMVALYGTGERFSSDTVKLLVYAFGVFALARMLTADMLCRLIRIIPFALATYCVVETMSAENVFTFAGRFALENTGSANTIGAMLALSILPVWLADYPREWRVPVVLVGVTLIAMLGLTFSRANIIGLSIAVLVSVPVWRMVVVGPITVFLALLVASLFVELGGLVERTQRSSVGRLAIWQTLLGKLYETPMAWMFGFGPGSVEFYVPSFTVYLNQSKYLYSPHSNFVGSLYCFGVYGFGLFVALLYRVYRKIETAKDYGRLKRAIGAFYLVTFMLDSHILASQGMFIHLVFMAFLMSDSVSDLAMSATMVGERRRRRLRLSFQRPVGMGAR